ncbi:MAG: CocE/NonD family hydrolase [Bacteroidetes bacterium]|nr:CocE/NonD family hydrolase [Bacteroidota bacterium]
MKALFYLLALWHIGYIPFSLTAQATYYEKQIPMRDSKWLAADLYSMDTAVAKPVILVQTPYNKNFYRTNIDIPAQAGGMRIPYDSLHYHIVTVDWRGFYGSADATTGGNPNRGQDGYDCIQWISEQSWCNGRVGTWGPSALGNVQFLTAAQQHPAHICAMPLVRHPLSGYEDYYTGGVYRKEHTEALQGLGFLSTSVILSNPLYNTLWRSIETGNDIIPDIQIPMLLATGWFDHYPRRIINGFRDMQQRSGATIRTAHKLIVGPWTHSDVDKETVGALSYPYTLAYTDSVARRFFNHYLRDQDNGYPEEPVMRYYQLGENRWHTTDQWPPAGIQTRRLYLQEDGSLGAAAPQTAQAASFAYDPHTPTPSFAGQRFNPFNPLLLTGPRDQSVLIESRSDVLTFETPVLTEPLVLQGELTLEAWVSLNRTDSDLNVRITDVYPDGKSYLLGEGIRRLRLRDTVSTASLLTPGEVYPVKVRIDDLAQTFLPGHRLRITVAGASHPRFDANLNNGEAMYTAGDTLICQTTLHMGPETPTALAFRAAVQPASVHTASVARPAIHVYPNPAENSLWATNLTHTSQTLALVDVQGKTVRQYVLPATDRPMSLDISGLGAGLYMAQTAGTGQATRLVIR